MKIIEHEYATRTKHATSQIVQFDDLATVIKTKENVI